MGKKKREHIVFNQMLKPKKSIPFTVVNKQNNKKKRINRILYIPIYMRVKGGSFIGKSEKAITDSYSLFLAVITV